MVGWQNLHQWNNKAITIIWFWLAMSSGEVRQHDLLNLVTFYKKSSHFMQMTWEQIQRSQQVALCTDAPPEVVKSRIKCRLGAQLTRLHAHATRELESRMPINTTLTDVRLLLSRFHFLHLWLQHAAKIHVTHSTKTYWFLVDEQRNTLQGFQTTSEGSHAFQCCGKIKSY